MIDYKGNPYVLVRDLELWYPGWNFRVTQCHGGTGIEAYRPETTRTGGLYAVITRSLADLRRELDTAKLPTAS